MSPETLCAVDGIPLILYTGNYKWMRFNAADFWEEIMKSRSIVNRGRVFCTRQAGCCQGLIANGSV